MQQDAQPYRARREALIQAAGDGLILVRGAAGATVNPSFFYLTGIREPAGALLLSKQSFRIGSGRRHPGPNYSDGREATQVLFLPGADPMAERWGEAGDANTGTVQPDAVGVDIVANAQEFEEALVKILPRIETLHVVRGAPAGLSATGNSDTKLVERIRRNFFGLTIKDATPIVAEMRRLKDPREVAAIERALAVTAEALGRAMPLARPGAKEYQVEAEITRTYRAHGGTHGFTPIVGAGSNALKLHYIQNTGTIADGDLVLIDTGVSIDGYGCDISRTFPASGTFSERQREVYEVVLAAQEAAIAACRPRATLGDVHRAAYAVIEQAGFAEQFLHGTSHHLGLETHDVGDVLAPLSPGAVITVEPGIYLDDEGIGIRIEDDVLITESEARVLGPGIPKTVAEIEALMGGGVSA